MKKFLITFIFCLSLIPILSGEASAARILGQEVHLAEGDTVHLCYTQDIQVAVFKDSDGRILEVEGYDLGGDISKLALGAAPGRRFFKIGNQEDGVIFGSVITLLPLPVALYRIYSESGDENGLYLAIQLDGDENPCVEGYEIVPRYLVSPDPDGEDFFPLKFTKIVSAEEAEEMVILPEENPGNAVDPDGDPLPSGGCSLGATTSQAGSGMAFLMALGMISGLVLRIRKTLATGSSDVYLGTGRSR